MTNVNTKKAAILMGVCERRARVILKRIGKRDKNGHWIIEQSKLPLIRKSGRPKNV